MQRQTEPETDRQTETDINGWADRLAGWCMDRKTDRMVKKIEICNDG